MKDRGSCSKREVTGKEAEEAEEEEEEEEVRRERRDQEHENDWLASWLVGWLPSCWLLVAAAAAAAAAGWLPSFPHYRSRVSAGRQKQSKVENAPLSATVYRCFAFWYEGERETLAFVNAW